MDQHQSRDAGPESGFQRCDAHLDEKEVGGCGGSRRSGSLGGGAVRWGRVMWVARMI